VDGDSPIDVHPLEGLLVAFSADVLHEVTVVRGGTRDAIVDWFYDAPRGSRER
jgi:predicted 2-oxoglutarate/Fe(II)-dependent dioxygenase YbiX